jgi:hypothetical protein
MIAVKKQNESKNSLAELAIPLMGIYPKEFKAGT